MLLPATVSAEEHYQPHIAVGGHVGASAAKVSFTPSVPQAWLVGPTGGISISYAEEKLVGVMAEFNFTQRGWAEKFENSPLYYHRSLQYVSLPILTHINFGPKRFKCFFNLGPEFSFLIGQNTSANFNINEPFKDDNWPEEQRMTEQLTLKVKNNFDYGICASFGGEFYFTPRYSGYLELRYYYGLGNVFPATKADTFSASCNMSIELTFGCNFRLK